LTTRAAVPAAAAAAKNISKLIAFNFLHGGVVGADGRAAARSNRRTVVSSRDQPSRCGPIRDDAVDIAH